MKVYVQEVLLSDESSVWDVVISDGEQEIVLASIGENEALKVVECITKNCLI